MTQPVQLPNPHFSNEFYQVLLANSRNLIFVKDSRFRILYANPAFMMLHPPEARDKMIGYDTGHFFDAEEVEVFHAQDQIALDTGFSEIIEEITDYTGRQHVLHTQKIRIYDQGEPRILGIASDITKLAERERALAQSNLALERFAAVAAHDLRSPVASVVASLDLIREDADSDLSSMSHRHIELATQCLEGLLDQVQGLLETYKAAAEPSAHAPCDMALLLEEVRFNLSRAIHDNRALVVSGALPIIMVERLQFRQLLSNLMENSLKYRSTARPIIVLRHRTDGDTHIFAFEDNGIGVAPEFAPHMFERGRQGNVLSSGAGIGLSLCRQIIEAHGGRMWLDTEFTLGCRICFTLPIV